MNPEEKRKFVQELTALIRLELNKDFHHILKSLTIPIEPIVEAVRKSFKVDIEEAKNEIGYALREDIKRDLKQFLFNELNVTSKTKSIRESWIFRKIASLRGSPIKIKREPILINGRCIHTQQDFNEVDLLLKVLNALSIKTALEIGCFEGGSLYFWLKGLSKLEKITTIDLHASHGRSIPELEAAWNTWLSNGQSLKCLWGSSQDENIYNSCRDENPTGFDFIHIDGHHGDAESVIDFEIYSKLIRPNGVIVIHDICKDTTFLWNKIKSTYQTLEIKGPKSTLGFGLVFF